jgi:hypothetical protein
MAPRSDVHKAEWWQFPQGSLPKMVFHAYLDENATEL